MSILSRHSILWWKSLKASTIGDACVLTSMGRVVLKQLIGYLDTFCEYFLIIQSLKHTDRIDVRKVLSNKQRRIMFDLSVDYLTSISWNCRFSRLVKTSVAFLLNIAFIGYYFLLHQPWGIVPVSKLQPFNSCLRIWKAFTLFYSSFFYSGTPKNKMLINALSFPRSSGLSLVSFSVFTCLYKHFNAKI